MRVFDTQVASKTLFSEATEIADSPVNVIADEDTFFASYLML